MSNFLNLNIDDLVKGFIVAFLSTALTGLIATLDSGVLPTLAEIKSAGVVGITAGLSYLLKNLLTNSQGQILKND
jgi:VIT1/CCC1 family predicted Fe2+/Mn2+ transporter